MAKFGRKFVGQTWLHEEACTARTYSTFSQRCCGVSGEQDDRNGLRSRVTLQILNQLPSVTASQCEISDDDVRPEFQGR